MITVGVDLAAEPKGTAVAGIEWTTGRATVLSLTLGATDHDIQAVSTRAHKVGIDCALGWPNRFVDFLVDHQTASHALDSDFGSMDWRRELSYRETDRRVREATGRWPLSVATDRLGVTALRCAGLVARLGASGIDVDRSGWGGIVEVYPAGSMKIWGFDTSGYRASTDARARLLDSITAGAPWFSVGAFREVMVESCDAFDSVVAALATRAAAIGAATLPSENDRAIARTEGWIALPLGNLDQLVRIP